MSYLVKTSVALLLLKAGTKGSAPFTDNLSHTLNLMQMKHQAWCKLEASLGEGGGLHFPPLAELQEEKKRIANPTFAASNSCLEQHLPELCQARCFNMGGI